MPFKDCFARDSVNTLAKKILVIGRNAGIMQKVTGMLTEAGYATESALTQTDAVHMLTSRAYSAVVIGGGVNEADRSEIKTVAAGVTPTPRVIDGHPGTILAELKHI